MTPSNKPAQPGEVTQALYAKATPRPWVAHRTPGHTCSEIKGGNGKWVAGPEMGDADADLTCHAVNNIERLEAENADLRHRIAAQAPHVEGLRGALTEALDIVLAWMPDNPFRARWKTKALAALTAPVSQGEGWQLIETAPKDGTQFIGLYKGCVFKTHMAQYYVKWPHEEGGPTFRGQWSIEDLSSHSPASPTHWMPLPPLPATLSASSTGGDNGD